MAILFKATSKEAEGLHKNLVECCSANEFTISKLSYPSHNGIHCFEIRLGPNESSDEIRAYIREALSGFSASRT